MSVTVDRVGTEFLVNSQTASDQFNPAMTGLAGGGFVCTWLDFSGTLGDASGSSIKAQLFGAGGAKVGGEFLVNTVKVNDQYEPAITKLANGGFVVSWTNDGTTPGNSNIKAQLFNASGGKVGGEFQINTQNAQDQFLSGVTGLAGGGFVATWNDLSGTLGDAGSASIKGQLFSATGSKVGSEFLVNSQTAGDQAAPTITSLAGGGFVVTWHDDSMTLGDASGTSVKAQIFSATGSKVGSEFLVNSQTANDQQAPVLAGLAAGGFVACWQDFSRTLGDNLGSSIKAQLYDATGNRIGGEFLVNSQIAADQQEPVITALSGGGFAVAWTDASGTLGDASGTSIKAQAFDAAGVRVGTELLVNSQAANEQFVPSITALADNGFVVSWTDLSASLGDAVGTSIKAQLFRLPSPNQPPVITSDGGGTTATRTIAENQTAITTVTATDPNAGTSLIYSIVGGADAALFQINASSGALSLRTAANFEAPADAGGNNIYDVIVRASDGTLFDDQALAVTITNVIEGNTIVGTSIGEVISTATAPAGQPRATAFDDVIHGLDGNDSINGGAGPDTMVGGLGRDFYTFDEIGDRAIELAGEGVDTVNSSVVSVVLGANIERATLLGALALGATGNELGNTLTGNSGANLLVGGDGNDSLSGKEGNDSLQGDAGQDRLTGSDGQDRLFGGDGSDSLTGGNGIDEMTGGTGADQFTYDATAASDWLLAGGDDVVRDFNRTEADRINLSALDANGNAADGDQAFTFIGSAAFTGTAGQLRVEGFAGGAGGPYSLASADLNGDGITDFRTQIFGSSALLAGDFIL